MIENITFKDCKINSVIFQNDTPVNVSNNGSEIGSLNVDSLGTNFTKSYISLIGDFSDSDIILLSNCNINCEQNFSSNKPITISSETPISVVLSGNFLNCDGLIINGPCSIITTTDTIFKPNFDIFVSVKDEIPVKKVSIRGDFSECNLNVDTSCNLNVGGSIQNLNINSGIQNQTLSLELDTKISSARIYSIVSVSGDSNSINTLKSNVTSGENNIIISSINQVILLGDNGIVDTNLNVALEKGQYKIIASISVPENNIQLGDTLIINVD